MRVILVGAVEDRRRLRGRLPAAIEVVGEAASVAAARLLQGQVEADGVLSATSSRVIGEEDGSRAEALTPRELDVLRHMAEGLPNKAIAVRLGISDQTVKFHVAAVCGKLDAVNRTDAVRRALRRGLISL
jgi:DNA-binding NarL/FixJ family response regulator